MILLFCQFRWPMISQSNSAFPFSMDFYNCRICLRQNWSNHPNSLKTIKCRFIFRAFANILRRCVLLIALILFEASNIHRMQPCHGSFCAEKCRSPEKNNRLDISSHLLVWWFEFWPLVFLSNNFHSNQGLCDFSTCRIHSPPMAINLRKMQSTWRSHSYFLALQMAPCTFGGMARPVLSRHRRMLISAWFGSTFE